MFITRFRLVLKGLAVVGVVVVVVLVVLNAKKQVRG